MTERTYELSAGLVLRQARSADIAQILALLADDEIERDRIEAVGEAVEPRYDESFAAIAADPRHELVVVTYRGGARIIATAHLIVIPGLSWRGEWRAQIQGVRVASHVRGQGIGHQLLRWAILHVREQGCGLVQVVTDKRRHDAHRFYVALGFRPTHEGFKLAIADYREH